MSYSGAMAATARPRPARARAPTLLPRDEAVLRALLRYHYLSARQLCRLLYSFPGSLTYAQTVLQRLVAGHFILPLPIPRFGRSGSSPFVYRLAGRGIIALKTRGFDVPLHRTGSGSQGLSYLFLNHHLAVASVLLLGELLAKRISWVKLQRLLHDEDFQRKPILINGPNGTVVRVVPDGYWDFSIRGSQYCLALELDRATEASQAWRRKIRGWLAATEGPYQDRMGTHSLTVVVITTGGAVRVGELLRWTEAELGADVERRSDLFRFASMPDEATAPEDFFFVAPFRRPFASASSPLISLRS